METLTDGDKIQSFQPFVPPDVAANFLEVFLGDYPADRGRSRRVTEVNIELVSASC